MEADAQGFYEGELSKGKLLGLKKSFPGDTDEAAQGAIPLDAEGLV
jgi:hypothetical protein